MQYFIHGTHAQNVPLFERALPSAKEFINMSCMPLTGEISRLESSPWNTEAAKHSNHFAVESRSTLIKVPTMVVTINTFQARFFAIEECTSAHISSMSENPNHYMLTRDTIAYWAGFIHSTALTSSSFEDKTVHTLCDNPPAEPSNIRSLVACELTQVAPHKFCLNDNASKNMEFMFVTLDTSHLEMSQSNDDALLNMAYMFCTRDTSHSEILHVKDDAILNMPYMFCTRDTFHLDM